ncbi:monoglyceride lipase-like [Hordeum vulgare]|uniref:Predicted protein n=1 Tax=Hordeum vulgare subsp. vulgare TaxID=112509 RepID=F2DKQ1_HORVV|nr:monoglyceride lipase-like [Hordeum vulgare]BAJ95672.1 predicted protein [Hordeum vulgare subsp. vulgare]
MAGSMQAADAAGRISALLSLLALRRILAVLQPLLLLLLPPFGRRARQVDPAAVADASSSSGKKAKPAVVLRVPAAVCSRRQALARREAAMRRAREAGRDYELIPTARGETLFTQSWWPHASSSSSVKPRALVLVMHGLNEHSGRYDHLAKRLNAMDVKVYGMDWTGHGGSDGLHGYVQSLDHAVQDMKMYLKKISAENPGVPCFCFGHSTGGGIILKAVLDPDVDALVNGIILTSPAVRVQPAHPIVAALAPVFALIAPRYQFTGSSKNGPAVSRDPEALRVKYSDPLVFTGSIRVRTGYEILRLTAYLQQHLRRITVPLLVLHGADDMVTDPEGSRRLHREASTPDKAIRLYDGLLHDLLIEPEKEAVLGDIVDWLRPRI